MVGIEIGGVEATEGQLYLIWLQSLSDRELSAEYDEYWVFIPRGCRQDDQKYEFCGNQDNYKILSEEIARRGGYSALRDF